MVSSATRRVFIFTSHDEFFSQKNLPLNPTKVDSKFSEGVTNLDVLIQDQG